MMVAVDTSPQKNMGRKHEQSIREMYCKRPEELNTSNAAKRKSEGAAVSHYHGEMIFKP